LNVTLAGCSSAEPASVSVQLCKIQNSHLYLQPVKILSHLPTVIHYIHKNAVHHGFSKNFTDWPWSSYHELANDTSTWLDREFVINWFGGVEKFRDFHQQPIAVKAELED
jgi:hypothetical protein